MSRISRPIRGILLSALALGAVRAQPTVSVGTGQGILWVTDSTEEAIIVRTQRALHQAPRDSIVLDELLRSAVVGVVTSDTSNVIGAALDALNRHRRARIKAADTVIQRNFELVRASVYLVDQLDKPGALAVVSHKPSGQERDIIILSADHATNRELAPAVAELVRLRHAPVSDSTVAVRSVVRAGMPAPRWDQWIVAQNRRDIARLMTSTPVYVPGYGTVQRITILVEP